MKRARNNMKVQGAGDGGRGKTCTHAPTSGLTLVEVMIAAAVLMIVITGLLGSFVALGALRESAKNLTLAINDAAKVMEEIRSTTFMSLRNEGSTGAKTYCKDNGGTWEANVNNASYWSLPAGDEWIDVMCCKADTNCTPPASGDDLIDVYVTVCWREGRGSRRVVGEDANLNGVLDVGEDGTYAGGTTGRIDSPAQLVSKITDRGT